MTTAHSAQLGSSVPIYTAHAVSVLLPTWQDKIYHELVSNGISKSPANTTTHKPKPSLQIYVLFLPDETIFKLAKSFWQQTGLGMSSRFAERALRLMGSILVREEG
ncbi:hypothetical protein PSTG_01760 [Puccinia striiformis f. sp. tritici PST-78]|uniref:Uncharacterized protein n=1 Tax=Puccinia striiformis f. sp. tritici PST-78 TaxID=1165861 RepID=A0A0L0W0T7_9BASI|nr:hypothetical protein PSTG_01760 [Puccinia striiformis f. sp. tritici PST-78]